MAEEAKILNGTIFFMKNQVRAWLTESAAEEACKGFVPGDHFVLELIDRPYRCTVTAGEGVVSVKLYIRSELGMYDDRKGDLNMTAFADGSEPMIWGSDRIDDGETIIRSLLCAGGAMRAMLDASMVSEWHNLGQTEGLVVKRDGETLQLRKVSGRKRPSLLCTTLFEGDVPVRPYADEIGFGVAAVQKDFDTLLREAEEGDEEAMEQVAMQYLETDAARAACWFEKLAALDDALGQFRLGLLYLQGKGVERNSAKALELFAAALENDHGEAEEYARISARLTDLEPKAAAGDLVAAAELAEEYQHMGCLAEGDDAFFAAALELAEKAAEANVPNAFWVLAEAYENGYGVCADGEQAVAYYSRGSELGHAGCKHSMGCLYKQGDYLIGDLARGIALIMESAEQGYGPAMLTIANCYQFGDGVECSMKAAVEWYERYLENHNDPELAHQVMHFRSIPGLVEDAGMEMPFEMPMENSPFGGFSIFGDDPFAGGGMSFGGDMSFGGGMSFGGDMSFGGGMSFGGDMGFGGSITPEASTVPMFTDDLLWTRLRAEAGDESAIALLAALEQMPELEEE